MSQKEIVIGSVTKDKDILHKDKNPKTPPVPIKTYKWEDIKRAKKLGGYPWTYLNYPLLTEQEIIDAVKFQDKMSTNKREESKTVPSDSIGDESADTPITQSISETVQSIDHTESDIATTETKEDTPASPDSEIFTPVDHTNVTLRHTKGKSSEEHIYEPIQRQSALDLPVEIQLTAPVMEGALENDKLLVITAVSDESVDSAAHEDDKHAKNEDNEDDEDVTKSESKKTPSIADISPMEQSMSMDEEKYYLDKKIVKTTSLEDDYNKWSKLANHEYEPVNPPPDDNAPATTKQPPMVHVSDKNPEPHMGDSADEETSSMTSAERQFLRIPLDNELLVPEDGNVEDQAMTEESGDDRLNATPTTIGSRTDCELNTSQVDSSALEQLPLKRESRKKATLAVEESTRGQNFKERFQNQAGKLRTRLQGIKKPNINLRGKKSKQTKSSDRPVSAKPEQRQESEKSVTKKERRKLSMPKMPERPKINLKMPDIHMPKMPDRPKLSMPKMPDRPKLSMPKMPDRSKLKMPERRKISMPKMPDRPKLSIPKMPDISMPKMQTPKINFPSLNLHRTKPAVGSSESKSTDTKNTETRSTETKSTEEEPSSTDRTVESSEQVKKRVFDFKTYPRLFDRSKKVKETSDTSESVPEKQESKSTFFTSVPDWVTIPRISRNKSDTDTKWTDKFTNFKFKEKSKQSEPKQSSYSKESVENNFDQNEDRNVIIEERKTDYIHIPLNPNKCIIQDRNRYEEMNTEEEMQEDEEMQRDEEMQHNEMLQQSALDTAVSFEEINEPLRKNNIPSKESISHDSGQEERSYQSSARGGVIEEINADEFFVREKGISQENIDVSKYISSEIREAFQTPKNALIQMSSINKSDESYDDQVEYEEEYPSEPVEIEEIKPPIRTLRKKKQYLENLENNADKIEDEVFITEENIDENLLQENLEEFKEENVDIKYEDEPPKRPSRRRQTSTSTKQSYDEGFINPDEYKQDIDVFEDESNLADNEENILFSQPSKSPVPPLRRKRSLQSSRNSLGMQDEMLQNVSDYKDEIQNETQSLSEHIIDLEEVQFQAPIAPKRRMRLSQSRSTIHSIDEDRTSHGADSLISEERVLHADEMPPDPVIIIDTGILPGYSVVNKQKIIEQSFEQPQTLPPPRTKRKKKHGTQFFTVPRRLKGGSPSPPQRPSRNYSTLQSRRRSRDNSAANVSNVDSSENKENIPHSDSTQYIEIDDDDSTPRHFLQSGEVIEKMKTRPLPAPPRPPRKIRGANEPPSSNTVLKDITADNTVNILRGSQHSSEDNILKDEFIDSKEAFQVETTTEIEQTADTTEPLTENIESIQIPSEIEISIIDNALVEMDKLPLIEQIMQKESVVEISSERKQPTTEKSTTDQVIEVDISTQTDPLPDDFCLEEVIQEPTDIIIAPTRRRKKSRDAALRSRTSSSIGICVDEFPAEQNIDAIGDSFIISDPSTGEVTVLPRSKSPVHILEIARERSLTPVHFPSDVIEPIQPTRKSQKSVQPVEHIQTEDTLPNKQIILEQQESCPQPIQIQAPIPRHLTERAEESTSQIQPQYIQQPQTSTPSLTFPETLKIDRLQVGDLDVERLTVSELLSQKLLVSEIDGVGLKVNDISSQSGNLVIDGIELSPQFFQQLFERLPTILQEHLSSSIETDQRKPPEQISVPAEEKPSTLEKSTSIDETNVQSPSESANEQLPEESANIQLPETASPNADTLQSVPVNETTQSSTADNNEMIQSDGEQIRAPPRRRKSSAQESREVLREPTSPLYQYPQPVSYALPPNVVQGIPYPHIYVLPPSFYPIPSQESASSSSQPVADQSTSQSKKAHSKEDVPDPSIPELSLELLRACSSSANKTVKQILMQISSHLNSSGNSQQDTKNAITILIVLIAGLILLGMGRGGDTVHLHHWEYFNPPGDRPL